MPHDQIGQLRPQYVRPPRQRCAVHALPLLTVCLALVARPAVAQRQVVVFYDHMSGDLTYSLPGDDAGRRRTGLEPGGRLSVLEGGRACFQIVNSNPLLYTYAAASKTVDVPAPNGLGDALALAQAVLQAFSGSGAGAQPLKPEDAVSNLASYARTLSDLSSDLQSIEALKTASDDRPDFELVWRDAQRIRDKAAVHSKAADVAYNGVPKEDDNRRVIAAQLRAQQTVLEHEIAARVAEFRTASARVNEKLCTEAVGTQRLRFTLSAKAKHPEGTRPRRAVNEVTVFEIEPRSESALHVGVGALVGANVARSEFGVADGLVTESPRNGPLYRVGIFTEGRLWPQGWLWASIGASKGSANAPDLFLGLVARPGISLAVAQLSIGAGVGLFQVANGLTSGAVGQALPATVKNIDDIVKREYRSAFAVTFTFTGLSYGTN